MQYPTTLLFHVLPNLASISSYPPNFKGVHGSLQRRGRMNLYAPYCSVCRVAVKIDRSNIPRASEKMPPEKMVCQCKCQICKKICPQVVSGECPDVVGLWALPTATSMTKKDISLAMRCEERASSLGDENSNKVGWLQNLLASFGNSSVLYIPKRRARCMEFLGGDLRSGGIGGTKH
jgi:hypothetical protein